MSPPELIQVNGQDVQVITYRGRRVITLAQMDRVHGKKPGTAGRAFRLHRNKLIKDEEYFRLKTDEPIGDLVRFVPAQGGGKPIIVLAEAGYLLLVKTFTDDLASPDHPRRWRYRRRHFPELA
jgi:ORF6N domain